MDDETERNATLWYLSAEMESTREIRDTAFGMIGFGIAMLLFCLILIARLDATQELSHLVMYILGGGVGLYSALYAGLTARLVMLAQKRKRLT